MATKYFYPSQDKEKRKEAIALSRLNLGRLLRIVTGHNNLAYHKSNINPDIDPMCCFCSEVQETFIHLFADCPAWWRERRELEGGEFGGAPTYVSPQQILDFSYIPRINEALEKMEKGDRAWQEMEQMSQEGGDGTDSAQDENSTDEEMEIDEPT